MKKLLLVVLLLVSFDLKNKAISISSPQKIEFKILTEEEIQNTYFKFVEEVDAYITKYSPTSKMSAKNLVDVCLEHDMDVVLAMSQAHVESFFGTVGIASRTNSVFNVGTFDDGTILYRYKHPDYSVEPYVSLMKRRYLIEEKTAQDLLKPKSFVNNRGKRYATLRFYEYRVSNVYSRIKQNTNIDSLQNVVKSDMYKRSIQYHQHVERINVVLRRQMYPS